MSSDPQPIIHTVFESVTGTWQYVVADAESKQAAVIDAVLDFDPAKNEISTSSADRLLSLIDEHGYTVDRILETHAHADHITAAHYLKCRLQKKQAAAPKVCIGEGIASVQALFSRKYGIPEEEWSSSFDHTFANDEKFGIGALQAQVLHLPGHTPDHVGYLIGENVFCGDSIFNPDVGSARADFPQGSAADLWQSMRKLLSVPPHYRLYTGHDYPPADRVHDGGQGQPRPFATVEEHRKQNKHVKDGTTEADFIKWRTERDSSLSHPRLIHQSLQFNIRAGRPPSTSPDGTPLLRVPLNVPGHVF
ncbi:hypothetical protein SLS56_006835 [Neofusicoccum ribis]|uniref:Metallo-beta-lactamase domain-containing protein n=1 Tax=Neofusicoccum ribis TaxID=45134 RepID=A0ABR3SPP6_9PEZI